MNLSAGPPLTALPQSSVPPCSPWPSALPSAPPSPLFRHYPQAPPSCPGPFPHEPLWAPFLTSFRSHLLRGPHPPPSSPFTTTKQKPKTHNKNHHHPPPPPSPPPQQPQKPTLNLSPRMPLTTSPQGPRLSVSLSIPSGLPSPAPTQPPRTLWGQGVPARLHAPRTRTGPTLPSTSPRPRLHFSKGSHPPSSCLSKLTLTSTSQRGLRCHPHLPPPRSRWPSTVPARSLPLHAPNPHACAAPKPLPAPLVPPQTRTFPPNTSWDLPSPFSQAS